MAWAPDYITVAELKNFTTIPSDDTVDDTELAGVIAAASRAIDDATNRQFGVVSVAEERVYSAVYDRESLRWLVEMDDLMTTTSLSAQISINGSNDGAIDGYVLMPRNAASKSRPWTIMAITSESSRIPASRPFEVAITGLWGWTSVPETIKTATKLQASRFFVRRQSPYGIAGSPESSTEMRLLDKLDPDVELMVHEYARWWNAP